MKKKKAHKKDGKKSQTQTFPHHGAVFAFRCSGAETYVNGVLSPIVLQPQPHNRCSAARKSTCLVRRDNLLGCWVDFHGFCLFFFPPCRRDEGESDLLCFSCRRSGCRQHETPFFLLLFLNRLDGNLRFYNADVTCGGQSACEWPGSFHPLPDSLHPFSALRLSSCDWSHTSGWRPWNHRLDICTHSFLVTSIKACERMARFYNTRRAVK